MSLRIRVDALLSGTDSDIPNTLIIWEMFRFYQIQNGEGGLNKQEWVPIYEKWRHGGWYVVNVRYPGGAIGCVSRNYKDGKWRIVCDPRPFEERPTFINRDAAARAERELVKEHCRKVHDAAPELFAALERARYKLPKGSYELTLADEALAKASLVVLPAAAGV